MASSSVYSAFKTYLQTNLGGSYSIVDFDEIEPSLGQSDTAFLALEEVVSDEQLTAMGDQTSMCMREQGTLVVYGFTPAPESSTAARQIIDEVRDLLRLQIIDDAIRITTVTPPDMDSANNGLWTIASTAVNYEYDFHLQRPGSA